MEKVMLSPSGSLPLRWTVTEWSSLVVALAGLATGGLLQITSTTPAGSAGALGEQTPVCVSGSGLVAVPITGKLVPVVSTLPQAVMTIVP